MIYEKESFWRETQKALSAFAAFILATAMHVFSVALGFIPLGLDHASPWLLFGIMLALSPFSIPPAMAAIFWLLLKATRYPDPITLYCYFTPTRSGPSPSDLGGIPTAVGLALYLGGVTSLVTNNFVVLSLVIVPAFFSMYLAVPLLWGWILKVRC